LTALKTSGICRELVTGQDVEWNQKQADFELPPGDVRVLEFK